MDLFTYLLKKKGHNSSVNGDLFSYLLASRKRGTYQTYTGTQINVVDSINARMKNWILGGNTNQNGTPTPDTPIDIHNVVGENNVIENTGKNLYEPIISTQHLNGLTPKIEVDESISISGTPTQQWSNVCAVTDIYLKAGTYTFSLSKAYNFSCAIRTFKDPIYSSPETNYEEFFIQAGQKTKTLTLTDNVYHLRFYITGMTIGTEVDENIKVQLETGSTATAFEKYKGKNYKVSLSSRNLFDKDKTQDGFYYDNTGNQASGYGTKYINQEYNLKNTSLTFTFKSKTLNALVRLCEYKSDGTFIKRTLIGTNNTTIVLDNLTSKVIFSVNAGTNESFTDLQIETGNEATPYVPYMTPIELCKLGDYQDKIYKSNDKWYLEKNIKKIALNSNSGNWYSSGSNNCFKTLLTTLTQEFTPADYNFQTSLGNNALCRILTQELPNDLYLGNKTNGFGISSTNSPGIYFNISGITSENDFRNWLNANNPTLYYVSRTPNITEITDDNLISQLEELAKARSFDEQTNITQLSEQLPFDLTVDIKSL